MRRFASKSLLYFLIFVTNISIITLSSAQEKIPPNSDKIKILLKWHHQYQFAGYYAALEKGYFAEEGLDVTIAERGNTNITDSVLNGEYDYGIGDGGIIASAIDGKPVVLVSQIFQHSPLVFIALKSSGIQSPYDLKGKTIMFDQGINDNLPLLGMLKTSSISTENVTFIKHSFNMNDFINGKVDAISAYMTNEPYDFRAQGIEINIISPQSYGFDFYGDNLFTSQSEIDKNPGRAARVSRAVIKGWDYALKNQNEIIDLIISKYSPSQSREKLNYEANIIRTLVNSEYIPLGHINVERYRSLAKLLSEYEVLKSAVIPDSFFSLLKTNHESIFTIEEMEWIKQHPVVTMGVDPQFPPYEYIDTYGRHKGMTAEYFKLLRGITGIDFQMVQGLKWEEVMKRAREKKIDVLSACTYSIPRSQFLLFTQVYLKQSTAIVTRESEESITDLSLLSKQKVALIKEYIFTEAALNKQPDMVPVYVNNVLEGLKAILNNEAKAMICGLPPALYEMRENNLSGLRITASEGLETKGLSIGVRNDWNILVSILNKALDAIPQEEHYKIRARWIGYGNISESDLISLTEEENRWLKENKVITITSYNDGAPYGFSDENGIYSGIIPELTNKIGNTLGVQFRYNSLDYTDLLKTVKEGSALITTMNDPKDTPYEEHYVKTQDFLFLPYSLFVRNDSDLLTQKTDTLKGRKIVLCHGWDLNNPSLKPLHEAKYIFGDSVLDCIKKVLNKEADGFYDAHSEINYILNKHSIRNMQVYKMYKEGYPLAFYIRKDTQILRDILNKSLTAIPKEEFSSLRSKWNTQIDNQFIGFIHTDLNNDEREWLKKHPIIKIGTDKSWAPIEYADEKGNYKGITIDYLEVLSEMLDVKFENVKSENWSDFLEMAKDGKIDLITSIAQTNDRRKYLSFTSPYISFPVCIVTKENLPFVGDLKELKGKTVGIVRGYATEGWLSENNPYLKLSLVDKLQDGLILLKTNKADAFIENMASCIYYIRQYGYIDLKIAGNTPYTYSMCMAVPKDREILSGIIDKALKKIPSEKKEAIYNKWVSIKVESAFNYSYLWKILIAVLIIIMFFIYWNIRLSKEVNRRTSALETKTQELQASREQLQTLMDVSPIAMCWTDKDGNIQYTNRKFSELFGYEKDEVPTLERWQELVYPDPEYRKAVVSMWNCSVNNAINQNNYILQVPSIARCKNNSLRNLECSGSMLPDKVLMVFNDLTGQKQSETALRESEERFRMVLEQAGDAVFLSDFKGNLIDVNKQACQNLGYAREELLKMNVTMIDANFSTIGNLKDFWNTIKPGQSILVESTHKRKNGSIFPVEIRICLIEIGGKKLILGLVRDISKRKIDEEALREQQETVKALVETSQDWIWEISLEGIHTYSNPAIEKILGYSPEDIIGESSMGYMHEEDRAIIEKILPSCIANKEGWRNLLIRWRHKKGGWRYLESSAVPILDVNGEIRGFRGVDRDVTERKRLETQLQQSQKMEAIGTLAGGIAHDFNNILSAILGYAELALEDTKESDPARESISEVLKAGRRAKDIIMQILSFSRQKEVEMRPIKLAPIVKESAKLLRASIPSTIEIQTSIDSECPTVFADAAQIHQVIMNLCTNAYYAMKDSGGILKIDLSSKVITLEETENNADLKPGEYSVLSISDNGCGMSKYTMAHIFEPYFTTKEKGEGTGFGLAVVHSIVQEHKGAITVYSEINKGSTFKVYFPATIKSSAEEQIKLGADKPFGSERVMFIDDEIANCQIVKKSLERLGYRVSIYSSPTDALSAFRQNPDDYEIIITDLTMPRMTGVELTQKLHEIKPEIPVILCSGFSKAATESGEDIKGISLFLDKPLNMDEIGRSIRKILDKTE